MSFKKIFKLTWVRCLFILGLFIALGLLKIFTLKNAMTGVEYKNSLFQQYWFNYKHLHDSWYAKKDELSWVYFLFLHIISSYLIVGVVAFIVNRLRGRE